MTDTETCRSRSASPTEPPAPPWHSNVVGSCASRALDPIPAGPDGGRDPPAADEHAVDLVRVGARLRERTEPILREEPHAVELTAIGQHGEEPRPRPRRHHHPGARHAGLEHDPLVVHRRHRSHRRRSRDQADAHAFSGRKQAVPEQHRDPIEHLVGRAHPEIVDPEWRAQLVAHELTERPVLRVGANHDLADDPSPHERVVRAGAGRKHRRVTRHLLHHPVPVGHELRRDALRHLRDPGAVGERIAHRRRSFAVGRVLGPVGRDLLLVVDEAALGLQVQRGRGDRLGHREHGKERVALHLPCGVVGVADPLVDDELAAVIRGDLHTDLALFDRVLEPAADRCSCHRDPPFHRRREPTAHSPDHISTT